MGVILALSKASFRLHDGRQIFRDIDLALPAGKILCILGPNGVGKSTLVRCIAGLNPLASGVVRLEGEATSAMSRSRLGRVVGLVPQSDAPVFAFTVREMVEMGRAAHLGWMESPGALDRSIADSMLQRLGIAPLANRLYPELSGGERQLVLIARALTQQPRLLILDEPTSHLDFANSIRLLEILRGLADSGMAVVMTSHNPDHAFLIADRTLTMGPELATVEGPTRSILTEAHLSATYGHPVRVIEHDGRTICFAATIRGENSTM